jgi:hypothetical protein
MSYAILAIEWFHSQDNEAKYGHAGIIVDSSGMTFEAKTTLRYGHISNYTGREIFITRPGICSNEEDYKLVPQERWNCALYSLVKQHKGQIYPFWRLFLHLAPALAKFMSINGNRLVCSELVAKAEWLVGIRRGPYSGVNPDNLADRWRIGRHYRTVFKGKLKY